MSIVIVIKNEKEELYVRKDVPEDMATKICEDLDASLASDKSLEAAEPVLDSESPEYKLGDYQSIEEQRAAAIEQKRKEEEARKEARKLQIINGVKTLVSDYLESDYGRNPFTGRDLQDFVILSEREYVITKWASAHKFGTLLRQHPVLQEDFQEQADTKPVVFKAVNYVEKQAKKDPDTEIEKDEYGILLRKELLRFARERLPKVFQGIDWEDIVQLPSSAFQRLRGAGYIININRTHFSIAPVSEE